MIRGKRQSGRKYQKNGVREGHGGRRQNIIPFRDRPISGQSGRHNYSNDAYFMEESL